MEKFRLTHVALYAKNQYQIRNIWEDLRKCLTGDDYFGEGMTNYDIAHIIMNNTERLPNHGHANSKNIMSVLDAISKEECWKIGYYTKDSPWAKGYEHIEYDYYEAIVRYCLSRLRMTEVKDFEGLTLVPNEKVLPLSKKEI